MLGRVSRVIHPGHERLGVDPTTAKDEVLVVDEDVVEVIRAGIVQGRPRFSREPMQVIPRAHGNLDLRLRA
jgi:hypothetical protein